MSKVGTTPQYTPKHPSIPGPNVTVSRPAGQPPKPVKSPAATPPRGAR